MDILARLNWVDVIVIIVMIRVSYVAFHDGLSHEIFPFIGVICTLVLALHYYNSIGIYLSQNVMFMNRTVGSFIGFLGLFVIVGTIFRFLGKAVALILRVSWHPAIEKFGGLVIGVMKASVVVSTILIMLALLPLPYIQWSIRDRSVTGMYFLRIGPRIYATAAGFLPVADGNKAPASESVADKMTDSIVQAKSIYEENDKKKVEDKSKWEKELHKSLTSEPSGR